MSDLDGFTPSPPERRLDDKAAELEQEIQALKKECRRIYFVLTFMATAFFLMFVSSVAPTQTISIAVVASLVFLIAAAKWLDFPWVVVNLERWHDALLKRFGKLKDGKEPIPEQIEDHPENNA